MDRRGFAQLVPALLAAGMLEPGAFAQQEAWPHGEPTPGPGGTKPKGPLAEIASGVYTPGIGYGSLPDRMSHRYLVGMLKAGNIQIEMHETHQEVGAKHEPVETHLHNEIWLVREGVCELMTNGVVRTMRAGDVGVCAAGDKHWVRNAGDTPCTYFVVTVGPPESYA